MADFRSLWRRFFSRFLWNQLWCLIPSSIRKYSYIFSKNSQPSIRMKTASEHSWGSADSVPYDLLQICSHLGGGAQLFSIELPCENTQMSGNKLVDTGCHLAPGPESKKPRQFETADASSAEPFQHASLEITANFPSSKLLLLPGLNTVCSPFKATEAAEWNWYITNIQHSSENLQPFFSCIVLCVSFSSHAVVYFSTKSQQS